ncbi:hypothetical protein BH18VER1_BH18VER1_11440 [soil metagenome]
MEQIFFLALVGVVALIRWLAQAAENKKNAEAAKRAQPDVSAPIPRVPAQTEEERIRRFMEALGVPKDATPPPRRDVAPKQARPLLPIDPFPIPREIIPPVVSAPATTAPAPEPAAPVKPPPLPMPQTSMLAQRKRTERKTKRSPGVKDISRDEISELSANRRMAARLATREGLRDAIVLREIFGPPRSMQPLDLTRAA